MKTNGQTSTLEQRFVAAISAGASLSDIASLLAELDAAITTAEAHARLERERALDPSVFPDPQAARRTMEDAAFHVGRLRTLLPRLQVHYQQVAAADREAAWWSEFKAYKPTRDALAEEFKQVYPECGGQLLDLFQRMQPSDAEI